MSRVGFIGLGTMGCPMAHNLIRAGHELVFFARRDDVADEFIAAGASRAGSPAEVARRAEFVVTIVTADEQLRQVAVGPHGIAEGAAAGKTLIEMSTISPATVRKVAERLQASGMEMIDAPVSGGPWGAESATLTIMIGGEPNVVEQCRSVLDAMGKRLFHVGPLGSGQTVKLVNQLIGGGIMALIGEGISLAKAAGVDLEKMADVVSVSSGNSALFEARAKKFVLANRYEPGFTTELMRKDVALALDLARSLRVPVPLAAAALQQYTAAMNLGMAQEDFASVAKVVAKDAGVDLGQ